jgi:hypothetical protein
MGQPVNEGCDAAVTAYCARFGGDCLVRHAGEAPLIMLNTQPEIVRILRPLGGHSE